ncbi:unnamed protein product [Rotaria sp. Silwood1]|nr:unnamed protein product [Rotaria sp. Silwood1]CAF1483071.1 unnamed protein product [Rotaria sp. Silwood1]CAF3552747.1 unnamed protein product [Rotaria sp. Silwood1]CAF3689615.1 unnamed protein product [Rotaria sp. Silwood1]CAF4604525.1 unnamed protein product [Rotaria sp. Silwood1]
MDQTDRCCRLYHDCCAVSFECDPETSEYEASLWKGNVKCIDQEGTSIAAPAQYVPFQVPPQRANYTKSKWNQQGITVAHDLLNIRGIFIDHNDDLHVVQMSEDSVLKFSSNNGGTVADTDGNLFITDYYNYRRQKWSPNSDQGVTIVTLNGSVPRSLYVDKQGDIYFSYLSLSSFSNFSQLTKYPPTDKTFLKHEVNNTNGIFVDQCGTVYIADASSGTVQKISKGNSKGVAVATGLADPWDVQLDNYGNLYVVEYHSNRVQRMSIRDGTMKPIINKSGAFGGDSERLNSPMSLAFDSQYNLYVTDQETFKKSMDIETK